MKTKYPIEIGNKISNKITTICHHNNRQKGFTLLELMITCAILAIIVAVAIPNYSNYTRRAHRADAKIALTEMANLQEKYYSDNGVYAATVADLNYPATSPDGYYTLSITMADAVAEQDFTVTATGQNGQQNDTGCNIISMNHFGSKLPANTDCWSR